MSVLTGIRTANAQMGQCLGIAERHAPVPQPYDIMVVLGRGYEPAIFDNASNDETGATICSYGGPSRETIENAIAAAELINNGAVVRHGLVIATGAHPKAQEGKDFSGSEAETIETLLEQAPLDDVTINIATETDSTTTFKNVENIRRQIRNRFAGTTPERRPRICVVSTSGHAKRGALLLQAALGTSFQVDALPINTGLVGPTDPDFDPLGVRQEILNSATQKEGILAATKERALIMLARHALRSVDLTQDDGFAQAEAEYDRTITTLKRSALRLPGVKQLVGKACGGAYGLAA